MPPRSVLKHVLHADPHESSAEAAERDARGQEHGPSPYFAGTTILNFAAMFGGPESSLQLPPPLPGRKHPQGMATCAPRRLLIVDLDGSKWTALTPTHSAVDMDQL